MRIGQILIERRSRTQTKDGVTRSVVRFGKTLVNLSNLRPPYGGPPVFARGYCWYPAAGWSITLLYRITGRWSGGTATLWHG
jgi:hypothetical protein